MESDFSFRVRLSLLGGRQLPVTEPAYVLETGDTQVVLRSALPADAPLNEASIAAIRGSGYPTEHEAGSAGQHWRGVLERAFAATGIAADFGDRSLSSPSLGKALTEPFEAEWGRLLLPDLPRMMVFPTHPEPVFMGMSARGSVRGPLEPLVAALTVARQTGVPVTPRERTAYTYYSAAVGETPTEAQFVLLMMALEALIDQHARAQDAVDFVDELISQARQSALDEATKQSLLGQLSRMGVQSIGEAGRELAATLGDRQYLEMPATRFFTRCYTLRSRLVHLDAPGPERREVETLLHPLRQFVGDLIAGPECVAVVQRVQGEIEAAMASGPAIAEAQA